MNRNSLTVRQRTKIAQKLQAVLEDKVFAFHSFVINLRKRHGYNLSQIGNMDETPMTFDLPGNQTVDSVGSKAIMIKTTGHEKTHFIVVLACMADGVKLKPVFFFRRKTLPKGAKFPSGVIVQAHPKGWMDEQGTQSWISNVWNKGRDQCSTKDHCWCGTCSGLILQMDVRKLQLILKSTLLLFEGVSHLFSSHWMSV